MLDSDGTLLQALHDPLLDGISRRPSRIDVESAWYGHVPFGYWLVGQLRPDVLVELGTHNGVSYAAFCDAVLDGGLPTRCFAVDTWQGDEHAGRYDEQVFAELQQFHDRRYGQFSRLLRMTFDSALEQMPDGGVDLLHIDGEHTYEAVSHDFHAWLPKLSDRAVVLFHDTNVRERNFGVWRLWHELRQRYSGFEFLHSHGLGMLVVGSNVPQAVADLCSLSDSAVRLVRDRFAAQGDRWEEVEAARRRYEELQRQSSRRYAELEQQRKDLDRRRQEQAALARVQLAQMQQQRDAAIAIQNSLHAAVASLREERAVILGSTLWRAVEPLRFVGRSIPAPVRRLAGRLMHPGELAFWRARRGAASDAPMPEPIARSGPASGQRIVFISGESHTPGHHYRVLRSAAAANAAGADVRCFTIEEIAGQVPPVADATAVFIWRTPWNETFAAIVAAARAAGAKIIYDVDDLMFLPELARVEVIDGIRSQNFDPVGVAALFENTRKALVEADFCTCPTTEIALQMRAYGKPAVVLPNGFDEAGHRRSRLARRRWQAAREPDLVRIGYAAGSRTHQKDFAIVADSIAAVLSERPQCRLVLFRTADTTLIDIEEYPSLEAVKNQIEWRNMRPLRELPDELARFDINLAPLEVDNPFCEAKSELKFFEAALVDVCTIASPTGPFRRSVKDGETGFLAATPQDWHRLIIELVDDPALRRRIGHAAYLEVLWQYGPQRREQNVTALLLQLQSSAQAAQAVELELLRNATRQGRRPKLRDTETVFHSDQLGEAEVSVVIPLHNYAQYVVEALDSVRLQSLAALDLIVIDDASTDETLNVAITWAQHNAKRFNRISVLRNPVNAGLAITRNIGIDAAETAFVFLLDADNKLLPDCCSECLQALRESAAAFAYPRIQCFGESDEVVGTSPFEPARLAGGNYIDAMALVAKWSWAAVGGYHHLHHGWEDYDFWCSLVEHGFWGTQVPRILAEYRVHDASMLRKTTDVAENKRELISELQTRHPWLAIPSVSDRGDK